ncbi:MAG: EAL domain-containing protein, partial [Spirochaetes bacterium]|nr:EAL domain-containing protein [Spirochaetota bacterium]
IDVAIDDFGTGYSSMEYLSKFPIDCLKIDMSFVKNLFKDSKNMAITKSIIALGYNLGLKIVAEGVETREQLDFLVEKGCDYIQGYFFSKPLPAAEALEFLEKTNKVKMG